MYTKPLCIGKAPRDCSHEAVSILSRYYNDTIGRYSHSIYLTLTIYLTLMLQNGIHFFKSCVMHTVSVLNAVIQIHSNLLPSYEAEIPFF